MKQANEMMTEALRWWDDVGSKLVLPPNASGALLKEHTEEPTPFWVAKMREGRKKKEREGSTE